MTIEIVALDGIPEVRPGDDLASMILAAYTTIGPADGDILVVTSKIVSKAEGRIQAAESRDAAIDAETVREVARVDWNGGSTRIVENRQGLVLAAAGVDASNVDDGFVLLLPEDPDASALGIARALREATGAGIGVIVSDTLGRAWRAGQIDQAIGAAGVLVADDLRGTTDSRGRVLEATVTAFGDELAAAADLVKGKASGRPVAVIRGLGRLVVGLEAPGARSLQRPSSEDLFRQGAAEAWREGYFAAAEGFGHLTAGPEPAPCIGDGGRIGPWALVVPIKPGREAKSRLEVPGVDRAALAAAIALDTLEAVALARRVAEIVVVGELPDEHGFEVEPPIRLVRDPGGGLRAAITAGLAAVPDSRGRAVLLGDLPGLAPWELDATLRAAETAARTFVPDAEGTGTTLVTMRSGMAYEPRFGAESAALHRAERLVELPVPAGWGLRRDVDTVEQLEALARADRLGRRTRALLADWVAGLLGA